MRKPTEVLAASIIKDILFRSNHHYQAFLIDLQSSRMKHEVLQVKEEANGEVTARILIQYNHKPMLRLQTDGGQGNGL